MQTFVNVFSTNYIIIMDKSLILNKLKRHKKFKTEVEFAKFLGITPQNLRNCHTRNSFDVNLLINLFPDVNREWLLTGDGEMLKKIESVSNMGYNEVVGTPVYGIDATSELFDNSIANENIIGYINLPDIRKDSCIVSVSGNSMSPKISNSDRIVLRRIDNWDYLYYGQVYLIVTEHNTMIKYVRKHDNPDKLILRSENSEFYDDIELDKDKICRLFIVEQVISIKNI